MEVVTVLFMIAIVKKTLTTSIKYDCCHDSYQEKHTDDFHEILLQLFLFLYVFVVVCFVFITFYCSLTIEASKRTDAPLPRRDPEWWPCAGALYMPYLYNLES